MAKVTHESLIAKIEKAREDLLAAEAEYKEFCKENPLTAPKQLSAHEIRDIQNKLNKASVEDHKKANAAHKVKA